LAKAVSALPNLQTHFLVIILEILLGIGIGPADFDDYRRIGQNRRYVEIAAHNIRSLLLIYLVSGSGREIITPLEIFL
jgi:hypothetical protein